LHSGKAVSVSPSAPAARRLAGEARGWERTQLAQLTPTDQGDVPNPVTSCPAIKLEGSFSKVAISWKLAGHRSGGGM